MLCYAYLIFMFINLKAEDDLIQFVSKIKYIITKPQKISGYLAF